MDHLSVSHIQEDKILTMVSSSLWDAMLSWKDSYTSKMIYKPSELGHAELVFYLQSSSVCLCGYDLCRLG